MQRVLVGSDSNSFLGKYGYIAPSPERRKELEDAVNQVNDIIRVNNGMTVSGKKLQEPIEERRVTVEITPSGNVIIPEETAEVLEEIIQEKVPAEVVEDKNKLEAVSEDKSVMGTVETFVSKVAGGKKHPNRRNTVEKYCMNHIHQISTAIVVVLAVLFIAMALLMYSVIMDRMYRKNKLIKKLEKELFEDVRVRRDAVEGIVEKDIPDEVVSEKIAEAEVVEDISENVLSDTDLVEGALTGGMIGGKCGKRAKPKRILNHNMSWTDGMVF